jgi:hypothetical protein
MFHCTLELVLTTKGSNHRRKLLSNQLDRRFERRISVEAVYCGYYILGLVYPLVVHLPKTSICIRIVSPICVLRLCVLPS